MLLANMNALDYHAYKSMAQAAVPRSFARLRTRHEAVITVGRRRKRVRLPRSTSVPTNDDIGHNDGFAEAVDCPVIIVADIDRGGVFAHIVGTLDLLSASEQARVKGFVINRFRGDIALLQNGLDFSEARTGRRKPWCLARVLPYLHGLCSSGRAEDGIARGKTPQI